jgi:hypothetical protein
MTYISKEEAEPLLSPFLDDIGWAAKTAWAQWISSPIAADMQHKRVRADCVWNQFLANIKRRFDGHPDVRVQNVGGLIALIFHNQILVRFKKGDGRLLSRNAPTQSAMEFHDCTVDMFGGVARLECIYVLDDAETDIERLAIVKRHKNRVIWAMPIDGTHAAADNNKVIDMPMFETGDSAADRVIKPKREKRGNSDGNGTSGTAQRGGG